MLSSFGVDRISKIPRKYREFMLRMPYVRRFGNTILSHAGVDLHRPQPYANRGFTLYNRSICPPDVGLGKCSLLDTRLFRCLSQKPVLTLRWYESTVGAFRVGA